MKNWASLTCGSGARTTVRPSQGPLGSNSTGSRDENRPFYGLSEVFRVEVVVPDVPTNLTATANGSTQIDLDWNAPASDGGSAITGYRIQVSPSSGSSNWSDLVADTGNTATEYSHTGLNPGTRRFYRVQAINAVGRSSRSTVADATTHRAPGPPTLLTATANGSTQIDLSWNAPVGDGGTAVTGYKIEHTLDGGANWSDLVADTGSAATEYSDTGLPPGATRYYRVFAINAVGTSDASNVARASADLVEMEVADDWDLIPSDLGSGHRFRLLFVSAGARNASHSDIVIYNAFVQAAAAAGHAAIEDYSSGFRAVGSTRDDDARDNTATTYATDDQGVPIYWLGGNRLADDYEDFYDGTWDDEVNATNASGSSRPFDSSNTGNRPFTGSDHDGTGDNPNQLGRSNVRVGRPDSGSGRGPINGLFNTARNSPRPFYGLSAVLRVEGELTPALSIEDGEGDEGGNVTFTVALSPMAAADVTATWTASIQSVDTAVLADDLEMTTGTLTVKAGEPTGTFTVPTAQDNTDEENETFTVTLSGASENALIAEATAQGTINDDDEPPVLSVTAVDLEVIEGESATFTVTLVPASGKRVTVFAISDTDASLGHTATGGKDYSIYEDVLTFEPGEISKTVTLATTDDELDEADEETFGLSVSFPANATLEGGVLVHSLTATVTISDNDDLPTLSVADVSAAEGDGLTFTVTLSAVSGRDVTVDWTAAVFAELSDSATSGTDFTADSGTLTFAPAGFEVFNELGDFVSYTLGEARKTFTVATTEDADEEENETFTVTLSNASNASIAEATAKGMINNDDAATLVSNTEQTSSSSASANATRNTFAVQFTTGDNANGYKLDSIGLKVSTYENVAVTVSLYSDDSGSPGSSIFTFDNPPSGITAGAVNTFTSPDDDVLTHLDAMTPYFIVVSGEIDISAGSTFDFLLAATNSDAEDTGGEDDWEIADERHSLSGTTWSTDSATLQIRVFGYPATGICGRTVVVQDIILYLLGEEGVVRTCAEVNAADLSSFTYLGWANENIGPLKSGDFAGLTNVTGIELGLNDFTTLPADLFSDMTALLSINLTAGKLTSLPDGVFSGLTALEILLLAGNDIGSLPAGLFSDLSALETLLLAGNDIGSLPAGLFSGLTALEILTLGGNPNPGDVLPLTVTVEKVGTDQARAKVLAGAPFAVDFTPTVVNGSLPSGVTKLAVAVGSVEGTAVTVTRTSGTTEAVTVDIDLTTQPSLAAGHGGYTFARATSGLPATILSVGGDTPTLPTLSVADAAGTEGGNVTFTATLSEVAAADVTATWTATIESGNTAVLADDLGATTTGMVTVDGGRVDGDVRRCRRCRTPRTRRTRRSR